MRDRPRYLVSGLAAFLALLVIAVVGPSSASSPARVRHPGIAARQAAPSPVPGLGVSRSASFLVPVAAQLDSHRSRVKPLGRRIWPADLLVVAPTSLPGSVFSKILHLRGVSAAESVDAARVRVNGKYAAILGVNPSSFRSYAARPVAASDRLWQSVAAGNMAVSYTMGRLDRLPLGGTVDVAGLKQEKLRVGSFATVGITGVDAVVSDAVARSLGFPAGNAIVISAPRANLTGLTAQIARKLPRGAGVEPLVSEAATPGEAGVTRPLPVSSAAIYPQLTRTQLMTMLRAALSRRGMRYVWGGNGPSVFDCSGLVQWSFAQAGIIMPRVAADQAITGPAIPLSQAAPGDLLFYHTDPTAPGYISHVAIYLGHDLMIQAPEPGMTVEVVPVALGAGFAGIVRVDPVIAARVAGAVG
ncbi:MAG TPA: NlpC/P60 family protein [Streptosporangiaceae bacterium]|nr:NlpC/P60 family protein [Streptosporangiaceae bacterium]